MKQRIQLKESQLRVMIAESVKEVLSELDWKTYANAAKKAKEYVHNNWNDDFRYLDKLNDNPELWKQSEKYFKNCDRIEKFQDKAEEEYQNSLGDKIWAYGPNHFEYQLRNNGKIDDNDWGIDWYGYDDYPPEDEWKKALDAIQSVKDFYNGEYTYDNKRGWHLKDK